MEVQLIVAEVPVRLETDGPELKDGIIPAKFPLAPCPPEEYLLFKVTFPDTPVDSAPAAFLE